MIRLQVNVPWWWEILHVSDLGCFFFLPTTHTDLNRGFKFSQLEMSETNPLVPKFSYSFQYLQRSFWRIWLTRSSFRLRVKR